MKRLDLVEYDCGPGCSSYGQVIAVDLDAEIVKVRDFEDGSVWRGLMDMRGCLGSRKSAKLCSSLGATLENCCHLLKTLRNRAGLPKRG